MTRRFAPAIVAAAICSPTPARSRGRPVHTYSIVARDAKSGELGVAVQSHWFSVGSVVTWAEAGVGAVATQSFVDPAYGPRGLDLMRTGLSAPDALRALISTDAGEAVRQVAFVDAEGRVAAHTGKKCIDFASQHVGAGYSAQANMMRNDTVVPAMAKAYEGARGDLAQRLLAALEAAEGAGGDVRGRQSAALLVVRGKGSGRSWADRVVELRVEDHAAPLAELRRLLTLHRAYTHMNDGDVAVEKGDWPAALRHYQTAARLVPDNVEMVFWHAVTLAGKGKVEPSLPLFREVFARDPAWADLLGRLHKPGILPDTPEGRALVERIRAEAGSR
jgi:uncharacterized Ntn-hydrolase superfamily protein